MTRSLPLGILALCTAALLGACTATGTTSAAIDKPAATSEGSTRMSAAPSATPTTGSTRATTSPAATVTVTAPGSTTTATATRTVTAKATGQGSVRVSAVALAFVSPSGRIGCFMTGDSAACEYELADRAWSAPQVEGCPSGSALWLEFDMVQGECSYTLLRRSAEMDANSMQPGGQTSWWQPGDPTITVDHMRLAALPYGTALVLGAFRCDSTTAGVFCQNVSTGHGFFMSREKYQVY